MSRARGVNALIAFLGPALLGLGTIFQPKAHVDDHWSVSPQVSIQVEAAANESGEPPHGSTRRRLVTLTAA